MELEFRIDVTNADIRAAKSAWSVARDGGAPDGRVEELWRGYEQLVRTQAQQIADDFRARAR